MKHLYHMRSMGVSETILSRTSTSDSPVEGVVSKPHPLGIEFCYNIQLHSRTAELSPRDLKILEYFVKDENGTELLQWEDSALEDMLARESSHLHDEQFYHIFEIGPRLSFITPWCSNMLSMLRDCGVQSIARIEKSTRYLFMFSTATRDETLQVIANKMHDPMTEAIYSEPLQSFTEHVIKPEQVHRIPLLEDGMSALQKANQNMGLGFDDQDMQFYYQLFVEQLQRNPTDVELFDLGQSNSEHSRHWFFNGKLEIDGVVQTSTLFDLVKSTLPQTSNSIIAFHDNSSAIAGYQAPVIQSTYPSSAAQMTISSQLLHPVLTAETHNFPCAISPFAGAETGTGGRIRDVQATGRGAFTIAGVAGYCVGHLRIPGNCLAWENSFDEVPKHLATPLDILIQASNGASDYGNKFGEPVITGFSRSFGQHLADNSRIEWIKPIMFTAGVGIVRDQHCDKEKPDIGMLVCKIGGPAYRIGVGGGATSSQIQGASVKDLNAVQRGDAEMENRMNRFLRACIEMDEANPILSIHDQGAGGNGNVLKEIVDPLGAKIEIHSIPLGDPTLSVLEIWGAEYQESNAILISESTLDVVQRIAVRENCEVAVVGVVTGDGYITVVDNSEEHDHPVHLPLSLILGKAYQKSYKLQSVRVNQSPLLLPQDISVLAMIERVFRLVDVGSKRFLTNKVDRSVTGLIAQQQCVGPLQTPLSNVAVVALSYFDKVGCAIAVGEQPIKGLVNNAAQGRMTVVEALSNLVFAKISSLEDVKASCNWMWAAKEAGEGAKLVATCSALTALLKELGPSIDGGKDSLSMAAVVGREVVKAPGEVVLTCYVTCPDITKTVTPDIKFPGESVLIFIDLGNGHARLGGSALATTFNQLGDCTPDLEDVDKFRRCFECIQELIDQRLICAGHDRSDGGIVTTLLEMCFAGNCGLDVTLPLLPHVDHIHALFSEECGFVLETLVTSLAETCSVLHQFGICYSVIGKTTMSPMIVLRYGTLIAVYESMVKLRDIWECTSSTMEEMQCDPICVAQECIHIQEATEPCYFCAFPIPTMVELIQASTSFTVKPRVAILRQEGSNGDRELMAAFQCVGFDVWDVNMRDLLQGAVTLDRFRGIAFCGGFSYADVNGSAKGWAGVIKFNQVLSAQFKAFRHNSATFSLGVCNGCQLMALLGWIPFQQPEINQIRFTYNTSQRFESRWSTVTVLPSNSIFLKDMAESNLGIWVAHGEGRLEADDCMLNLIDDAQLAPVRYVDDQNEATMCYPKNPSGSARGIAGLSSEDGRHLALMPHPERSCWRWQMPYDPVPSHAFGKEPMSTLGPWVKLFQNAFTFAVSK